MLKREDLYHRVYDKNNFKISEEKKNFSRSFYEEELHEKEYEILESNFTKEIDNTINLMNVCSICLGEFREGDKLLHLPKCNHEFHFECLEKWCKTGKSDCPYCRRLIRKKLIEFIHNQTITSDDKSSCISSAL